MPEGYLSFSATVILQAVGNGYGYGFDIMDATGLPSGTVYPALRRMEAAGHISSRWENPALAQREQRPARKYYELTRAGHRALADAASRYRLTSPEPVRVGKPSAAKR
ncbi:MAG TPA: PadR family transcriptional regulator [Vicinamibacterales bacterium]|nr:PadR family transcriptional regulator [Vicinamibacterales bacterium]